MRRRLPILALLALIAGGLPCELQAQEARVRAQQTLPDDVFQELDALATAADAEGIPGELIFSKALEGAAKRVPANRLVPAVEAYTGRLRVARGAFGPGATGPLLVAGADALQRGVEAEALRGLGDPSERSPMAVLVLAELVETGVPAERALGLVREAMQRRARQQEMLGLPARVRQLMQQGRSPQDAAEQVRRALQRGRGSGVGPPVPPGSEPVTRQRRPQARRPGGSG